METEYVILPEFSTGEIIKIKLSERQKKESEQYDDFEEYLATLEKEYEFRLDDCQWMVTETYLERKYGFWYKMTKKTKGNYVEWFLFFFFPPLL